MDEDKDVLEETKVNDENILENHKKDFWDNKPPKTGNKLLIFIIILLLVGIGVGSYFLFFKKTLDDSNNKEEIVEEEKKEEKEDFTPKEVVNEIRFFNEGKFCYVYENSSDCVDTSNNVINEEYVKIFECGEESCFVKAYLNETSSFVIYTDMYLIVNIDSSYRGNAFSENSKYFTINYSKSSGYKPDESIDEQQIVYVYNLDAFSLKTTLKGASDYALVETDKDSFYVANFDNYGGGIYTTSYVLDKDFNIILDKKDFIGKYTKDYPGVDGTFNAVFDYKNGLVGVVLDKLYIYDASGTLKEEVEFDYKKDAITNNYYIIQRNNNWFVKDFNSKIVKSFPYADGEVLYHSRTGISTPMLNYIDDVLYFNIVNSKRKNCSIYNIDTKNAFAMNFKNVNNIDC